MIQLIAVSGGIGAGKSVVCRILRTMGFPVYDCDVRARQIMDGDSQIHARLTAEIHPDAVVDGKIDRTTISKVVFNDPAALARLNAIVHGAVLADLDRWKSAQIGNIAFVETAIPVSSGIAAKADRIWQVDSSLPTRIARVKVRNNFTEEQVVARHRAQQGEMVDAASPFYPKTDFIVNDESRSLLAQIQGLLAEL